MSPTTPTATSHSPPLPAKKHLVVDPFCFRQFAEKDASRDYSGTVLPLSIQTFEEVANALYRDDALRDGYAPFCKHLFLPVGAFFETGDGGTEDDDGIPRVNVLPLAGNEHLVRTEYAARNDKEVPVLQRFIPRDALLSSGGGTGRLPPARYLDLILYSREQIRKENESMGTNSDDHETAPWGVVSIKAQLEDFELPMNPITQMRNALGKDQGGSGVPLDREEYMRSVEYWSANVVVS